MDTRNLWTAGPYAANAVRQDKKGIFFSVRCVTMPTAVANGVRSAHTINGRKW